MKLCKKALCTLKIFVCDQVWQDDDDLAHLAADVLPISQSERLTEARTMIDPSTHPRWLREMFLKFTPRVAVDGV